MNNQTKYHVGEDLSPCESTKSERTEHSQASKNRDWVGDSVCLCVREG